MIYKLMPNGFVLRTDDNVLIPADPANSDYAEYLLCVLAGNSPQPADPLITNAIPQVVSSFQGRAALMQAGYLDDVEQYMETADPFEKLAWDTVTEMRRTSPLTIKLAVLLGLTDGQVNDMFAFAFTISA